MSEEEHPEESRPEAPAEGEETPQPAEPESPEADYPEAAPTDLRKHVWLLVIILGVVVLAWIASFVAGPPSAREAAEGAPEAAQPQPTRRPAPEAPQAPAGEPAPRGPVARPVQVVRSVGRDSSFINASPPRRLGTGGPVYRVARVFNVTDRAPDADLDVLCRMPGRHADQQPTLVTQQLGDGAFKPAAEVQGLAPDARLLIAHLDDGDRAYPLLTLERTAAVADTLGGRRLLVCLSRFTQLASCLIVPEGTPSSQFADAGLLYRGNLVLYDRPTGSLWETAGGLALTGPHAGKRAERAPVSIVRWGDWSEDNANVPVLDPALGPQSPAPQAIRAGRERYLESPDLPVPLQHFEPGESPLPAKTFVLGVPSVGTAKVYPLEQLAAAETRVIEDSVGGRDLRIHVTSPRTGRALSDGQPVDAWVCLWFAWKEAHPETEIYAAGAANE